jgi:hypothetical protein
MLLAIGGQMHEFIRSTSLGTGLNGTLFHKDGTGDPELLYATTIVMSDQVTGRDEPQILIFRDRVFWPCER